MPYEPIHHKYRPQTFKDLVGQETIALTLSNALEQEKIATAYLFTGPRGTGKTSSARILAKSLNCLAVERPTTDPCGKCEVCLAIAKGAALDVMEIDAASNTGVDNIREIIERSRFAPVQCRYKIYAIDECHMLSTAAFNALLKTLEEPPPQVVFILATTDPQRVLSTIISRCQRFDYRRIPLPEMVSHLKYIAAEEKIAIADDALNLIAQIANGGLRDAESLLDQLSLLPDTISVEKVWDLVGAVPEQDLLKLLHAINQDNSLGVIEQCRNLLDRGREPIVVLQNLAGFYLNLLIAKTAPQRPDMVAVTETCWQQLCHEANDWDTSNILRGQQHLREAENQLKRTTQPRLWLEVTLLSLLPQARQTVSSSPEPVIKQSAPVAPIENAAVIEKQVPQNVPQPNTQPNTQVAAQKLRHSPQVEKPPATVNPSDSIRESPPVVEPEIQPSPLPKVTTNSVPVEANNVDIQGMWSQVVDSIPSRMTQALLKQQCHLVSFDGGSAIVGISSATLQKLNQNKVPIIEKAFAQVTGHTVRVQLEVASKTNTANNRAKKNSTIAKESTFVPPKTAETAASNISHNSGHHETVTNFIPEKVPETESKPAAIDPVREKSIPKNKPSPQQTKVEPVPVFKEELPAENESSILPAQVIEQDLESDYGDDSLQKAIASLTHSFEGELVDMGNDSTEAMDTNTDTSEANKVDVSTTIADHGRPNIEEYDDEW